MSTDSNAPPPDAGGLYQAALRHLARYAATEAGLRSVLLRRIDRWARAQTDQDAAGPILEAARASVDNVVRRLAQAGAVNDAAFAENRARNLGRGGRSSRTVELRLIAKGVASALAHEAAATDRETELGAALTLARRRRIGPYRASDQADTAIRLKELAMLARAGFSRDVAKQALDTSREDAERRIFELRR